jgi:hypothetical protein
MSKSIRVFLYISIVALLINAVYNGNRFSSLDGPYVYEIRFEQTGNIDYPCSATIISDFTFLTAAHCADRLDLSSSIYLNSNEGRFLVESIFIPLAYYDASSKYRSDIKTKSEIDSHRNLAQFDIAIINMKTVIPLTFNRIQLSFDEIADGSSVVAMRTSNTMHEQGPEKLNHLFSAPEGRKLLLTTLDNGIYLVKGKSSTDFITKLGDSGGALLLESTNKQIAVLRGSSSTAREFASIYTPLSLHQSFIKKYSK